jgi:hypothetical protein
MTSIDFIIVHRMFGGGHELLIQVSHDSLSNVIGHDCEIMFIHDVRFSSILNGIHQKAFNFHL